ncbi:restriction endonuclease subunit S [Shewanella sp. 125m-1]
MAEHDIKVTADQNSEITAEQLIIENLDIWTSAIEQKSASGRGSSKKFSLHGIKKLRELILELAVRGKLVPQASREARNSEEYEPASVLLERIAAEKAQLVKDKKIKKPKALPEISEDEKPFDLPKGWEWARLQDISSYIQRGKGPSYAEEGTVRVISQKCVQNTGFDISPARFVTDDSLEKYQAERFLINKDILWNSTGTGTVGRANVITNIEEKSLVADSHVTVIRPTLVYSRFIWCFIMAPGIQSRIEPDHENALVSGSTKQVELNTSSVITVVTSLPPLEEQYRIVAKVDELMSLCDALEAQTEASISAHQTLVETLLGALLLPSADANSPERHFIESWQRVAEHFDTLFTTSASIDTLKQTILQLAVMGKLVEQDANDEPAAKLLERIAAEKAQLIADKKIKKQKPLPAITDEEKPFELPKGWALCRIGQVINLVSGQHLKPNEYSENSLENGVPYITGPAEFGSKYPTYSKYTTEFRALAKKNDILITCKGAGLGKLNLANETIAISRQLMAIQSLEGNLDFLFILVDSQYQYFQDKGVGIAIPGISRGDVEELVLMLPPLEEQHRIVAKVDELMALCDQLKARLSDAQTTQLHLTDAIVEQAV